MQLIYVAILGDDHFFASSEKRETDRPEVCVQSEDRIEVGVALRIHRSAVVVVIGMNHPSYLESQFQTNQTSAIAVAEGASIWISTVSDSDCV